MRTTALLILLLVLCSIPANAQLNWTFNEKSCPNALPTIKAAVKQAGCDGWILLDDSATITGEKVADSEANSSTGFDITDTIKSNVETACCGVVSSADIVAVAARDSVVELGCTPSTVVLERRDSNTPPLTSSLATLVSSCSAEEHSAKDMVALSEHEFDVFINHRGKDVKETLASLIFHNLRNKGLRVFLDKNSIPIGGNTLESIEQAIYQSSVHIVIFSPSYAESEWCLSELYLMSKTGAPIIPIFYGVRPSELRMEGEGVYSQAFQMHEKSRKFKKTTLEKWKKALCDFSYIRGIKFEGDQGELLERIAISVSEYMGRRKF